MTFYAGFTYLTGSNSTYYNIKNFAAPSSYVSVTPSNIDLYISDGVYLPIFVNSNNTVLSNVTSTYTGDYANYVIVNNDTNNWVLTLPLGPGSDTNTWRMGSFLLHIKKTGTGTLTIQTPVDTIGTRIRGINTTSNKSYTLSNSSAQSIILLYTYGLTDTGSAFSQSEIWHVIS